MDKCGICLKPAVQLFETGKDGVYACFKCQPLVPEITIEDNNEITIEDNDEDADQAEQSTAEAAKNEEENSETSLYCGICHKTFQRNMQLQNHLRNHRAERRFVCTYCNKAFSQSNNLRAHLRIHTNERPYKCSECGKAFTQVTNLNNHVRLHTGERPFVCPEPGCSKAYAQVTNLNQHRKRHLNGRPVETTYDCTICGEQFQQRNHMYTHRRDVHAELPKNPSRSTTQTQPSRRFVCKLCDLSLPSERLLQHHTAQHAAERDESQKRDGNSGRKKHNRSAGRTSLDPCHKKKGKTTSDCVTFHVAHNEGEYPCVFSSCGARLSSPHEHTEHLLRAHQLRVLAARASDPPRRGRPPKTKDSTDDSEKDPLAIDSKEPEFQAIRIVNAEQFQFLPKIKVQSMFQ